jgi:hypothetical protein
MRGFSLFFLFTLVAFVEGDWWSRVSSRFSNNLIGGGDSSGGAWYFGVFLVSQSILVQFHRIGV